jgi:hypothetical protein
MPLHRDIFWIGKQWSVTGYGMQAIDQKLKGQFDIEVFRIWDDDLHDALSDEKWFNAGDFDKGLAEPSPFWSRRLRLTNPWPETTSRTLFRKRTRILRRQILRCVSPAAAQDFCRPCASAYVGSMGARATVRLLRVTKFFKVSNIDHGTRCRTGHCETLSSARCNSVIANSVTLPSQRRMRYARISADIPSTSFRNRAATLPDVPAESHAVVEAGGGTVRLRLPHIRVPEVRSRSDDGRIKRSHGIRCARLACRRVEAADEMVARQESLGGVSLGE